MTLESKLRALVAELRKCADEYQGGLTANASQRITANRIEALLAERQEPPQSASGELVQRITDCLAKGGLFNMEVMEAGKVRDAALEVQCGTAPNATISTNEAGRRTAMDVSPSEELLSRPPRIAKKKSDFNSPEEWEKYLDSILNAPEANVMVNPDGTCTSAAQPSSGTRTSDSTCPMCGFYRFSCRCGQVVDGLLPEQPSGTDVEK